jgi:phosphoglycerol transferase MdoB-like AlkP superfamily enzyme
MPNTRSKLTFMTLVFVSLTLGFALFRLAFLGYFEGFGALGTADVLRSMFLGTKFDMRLAAMLLVPAWLLLKPGAQVMEKPAYWRRIGGPLSLAAALAVYVIFVIRAMPGDARDQKYWLLLFLLLAGLHRGLFKAFGLETRGSARWLWSLYLCTCFSMVILVYLVDFGAYGYIHTRLNGTLLMFLENAGTSFRMMWESYPFVRLVSLLVGLTAAVWWALKRLSAKLVLQTWNPWVQRSLNVGASLCLIFAIYGKWSRYPLRWSEAFEAKTSLHAHLALNPVLFFLETRIEMDGGYDLAKVRTYHPDMAAYFGIPVKNDSQGLPTLLRSCQPSALLKGKPNIVFIQLESFAGFKTGILGNPMNPTPFFDELCRKGLFFDHFYTPMENTSRSMFCTLFGIADVSSVDNATRNPMLLDQYSILRAAVADYDKSFNLGGSANWAQIRGILKQTFPDLTIYEEGSYKSPVVDVWGVCDADLLLETHERLKTKPGPFWAYIQTSGNHPPFTIPKHYTDFQILQVGEEQLVQAGFTGNEEYNAVRFMDYSLKTFFETARQSPYFDNTVFVLWGDHGIPRGSRDLRFGDLGLAIHHVPFLIYAPGLLKEGRRISTVASQMDLMPTFVSMLGKPYVNQTLGKDLLDPAFAEKAAAFTFTTFRRPPRVGLIQGDWYVNVEPDGRSAMYRLDETDPKDHSAEDPERARAMTRMAEGFHQWSKYLLSHNKPGSLMP